MRPGPQHIGTTGAVDGDALLYDADLDEYAPGPVATTAGAPLVTVVDGTPGLVFDNDGSLVYTEGAS